MQPERAILPAPKVSAAVTAIVTLINSRPQSPTALEIQSLLDQFHERPFPASPFLSEVRRQRKAVHQAVHEECTLEGRPTYDAARARAEALEREFQVLTERIWAAPVGSWGDVVPHCEIALRWIDRDARGGFMWLESDCCVWERTTAHLVRAVAKMGGCDVRE